MSIVGSQSLPPLERDVAPAAKTTTTTTAPPPAPILIRYERREQWWIVIIIALIILLIVGIVIIFFSLESVPELYASGGGLVTILCSVDQCATNRINGEKRCPVQ